MKKKELEDFLLKGNLNLLPATFLDDRESQVLSRVSTLLRYLPDEELYPSLLLTLLQFPKQFKKIRSISHLGRVICAEFFYKKKVIKAVDNFPHKRHLYLKLLKTRLNFPFGSKGVMGMVVAFNLLKHREAFEEQHILEAVRRVVPGVDVVKGSLIDDQDKQNQIHTVYFEIEREENPEFSLDEIQMLENTLPDELKGCIEQLVPMTFMRRNEEEVYRNILALRDQLKSIRDIPHATITFEEQTQFDLFFTVVLLRIVKQNQPSVLELLEKSFLETVFIPDRTDIVGTMRKIYQKEATVFRVQLPKSAFFRKDRSVNLYKARRDVVEMLMQALGPIRDYNGGLILKQNERLEDFLALMPKVYDEFFLENFFYSITPIAMQSILSPAIVKEWFLAFSQLLDKELFQKEPYLLSCRQHEDTMIVIIRVEDRSCKDFLLKRIQELSIPSLELGCSEVNRHGSFCFGFLYRPSLINHEFDFSQVIRSFLNEWSAKMGEDQTLRIALHGIEPSLDPRITKGDQSYIIIKMLFEGLTRIGPDGKPHLAIAKSYEVSSDFKNYTFHLRETKWSNGAQITAHDFEYSWKNALNPHANSVFANTLFMIKNARLAKENRTSFEEVGIYALDEKTLRVELEYPVPYFLEVVAHWTYSLINRVIDQKHPGWAYQAGETFVCNGPFKLFEWRHNRAITVEKNPHYWDSESVKLNRISINMMERIQTDIGMLKRGEIDILGRPMTPFPVEGLDLDSEDLECKSYGLNGVFIMCFNTAQFPFNNKKIRQAFAHAIDREKIGSLVPHEFGGSSYSLLPHTLSLAEDPLFPKHDLERARVLFRQGLKEIGFVKTDFPALTISYYSGLKRRQLFEVLCEQWNEAFDIQIHLEDLEWGTHFNRMLEGKYQMGGIELNARWSDPLHLLEFFEERTDLLNFPSWEHPEYRSLLEQAKKTTSLEKRDHFLKEAEAFLADETPAIPLYQLTGRYLKRKGLKDVSALSNFQIDFKRAYKE